MASDGESLMPEDRSEAQKTIWNFRVDRENPKTAVGCGIECLI
jgi:hypothetical protein